MQPGYMVENCTGIRVSSGKLFDVQHVAAIWNLCRLLRQRIFRRQSSRFCFYRRRESQFSSPTYLPSSLSAGTWPARVFVFPVTEPTMINLFCSVFALTLSCSNNSNDNKWCAVKFHPDALLKTLLRERWDRRVPVNTTPRYRLTPKKVLGEPGR